MRTRFRKISTWFFSALFSVALALSILSMTLFVKGSAVENPMTVTTTTSYSIAKGVTLEQYIVRSETQKQSIGYMTTVDLSQDVKILASYTGYYTKGSTLETRKENAALLQSGAAWSMSQTTRQAEAYESIADTEGTVVVATNGDYFNMQTGKPSGYLVMEGQLITTGNSNGNEPYFAILKDGTAVIREAGTDTSDVAEAISGPYWLIKDGEIVADRNDTSLNPRNSVGVKADGSVVLFEFDGRQEPLSAGLNYYELACMLKDAGCVDALYLDGGGSATVAARKEGTDNLAVVNNPSDGIERTVSSALLVVSTAYPTGEFDHAVLSPNNEVYTPESEVAFTAAGVDPSGAPAPLPDAGMLWVLDTKEAGSIDALSGVFTAAKGYCGSVSVHLEYNGKNVGEVEILIAEPDEVRFSSSSISLDYEQESDLGLTVSGNFRTIHYKDGDFDWQIIPEGDYPASAVGSVTNNIFKAGARTDTSMRAQIVVTYTMLDGNQLIDAIDVEVGKLPEVLIDFETQQSNGLDMGANSIWGNTYSWNNQEEHDITGFDPNAREGKGGFGNAEGTAKDPNGVTIPATIEGDLGMACGDFVNGVGACNCWNEAPYGWDCANDPGALYREMGYNWTVGALSSAGDGAYNMYAQRVNSETGEVRFDDYALEFHYDYTQITGANNTNEMLVYTGQDVEIEGTPTGIGMWIYVPEGTSNYWLMTYIAYWNKSTNKYTTTSFHFGTTTVNTAGETVETTTQYTGINWTGWKYVEADISSLYSNPNAEISEEHPLKYTAGVRLLNLIIIEGGTPDVDGNKITCGSREAGSIYIDNVRAVYGTTIDDMDNPIIDSVAIGPAAEDYNSYDELSADKENILYSNELQIFTQYHEYPGQYATGISVANTEIIVDGKTLSAISLSDQALASVVLPNGRHSVKVEIMDGFGNRASVEYAFWVQAPESDIPELGLFVSEDAWLGDYYTINLSSENIEDIREVILTVNYGNIDKLDASTGLSDPRLTAAEITYGDQFDATIYTHTNDKGQSYIETPYQAERLTSTNKVVLMKATAKNGASGNGNIITFSMKIPPEMLISDTLPIGFSVEYTTADGGQYTLAIPFADYMITPAYNITADNMVAGGKGGNILVTDYSGKPVSGVYVSLADGTKLGMTDAEGLLHTTYFSDLSAGTSTAIYAVNEAENGYSFKTQILTLKDGGDASGQPMHVQVNATPDAVTTQNITWMTNPLAAKELAVIEYAETGIYESSGALTLRQEGRTTLYAFTTSGDGAYINAVTLTGLKPGTSYSYRVGDGEHWSEVMTFVTSDPDNRNTNFFVIGDTQLSGSVEADADAIALMNAIAAQVNSNNPNFGIQTGDFVDNGGALYQWNEILDVFVSNYPDIPIVQVMGNHEYYGDLSGEAAETLWSLPNELYYSVEYNNVYVAVINYAANLEEACAWLIEDANQSDCAWKVLTLHQPAYYTNPKGSSEAFNRYIPSAAEAAGIDVVFSGHDHSYARTQPMIGGEVNENGIVYYICGDLGEKSRGEDYKAENNPDFNFAFISQDYESVCLSVNTNGYQMTITAYNVSATGVSILDEYTINKPLCANGEHSFVYDPETGYLDCENCAYYQLLEGSYYTGWATEKSTGRKIYFVECEPYVGDLLLNGTTYYFGNDGYAVDGTRTIYGEQCTFEDGVYIGSANPNVVAAGYSGTNIEWIIFNDGIFKVGGIGAIRDYETTGLIPWYKYHEYMRTLYLGNEINIIGSRAFSYCNLRTVIFEQNSSLVAINAYAFQGNLFQEIALPDSMALFQSMTFGAIPISFKVILPDNMQYINSNAFYLSSDFTLSVAPGSYAEKRAQEMGWKYEVRNDTGIIELNSGLYYYVNGVATEAGLMMYEGRCYYAGENGKLIVGTTVEIGEGECLPAGSYAIGDDGVFVLEGIVEFSGEKYYFVNSQATFMGVLLIERYETYVDANGVEYQIKTGQVYNYFDETGKLITQQENYYIEKTNGFLPAGNYKIDEEGNIVLHNYKTEVILPTCTMRGYTVHICESCGDSYLSDFVAPLGHTESEWIVDVEASCTSNGTRHKECTVCGEILEIGTIEATGHSYEITVIEPSCTERGYSVYTCSVCGSSYTGDYVEALGHTEGEWIVDVEASCTSNGTKHKECTVCGEILEIGTIEATGHSYEITVIEPSCTERGYSVYTCSVCGSSYTGDYVEALGHTEGEWLVDVEASCTSNGTKHKECTVCGEILEIGTIEATGHSYEITVIEPSCTEQGYTKHTCSVCGETYIDSFVEATGHVESGWIVDQEPGDITEGIRHKECTVCHEVLETENIPALGEAKLDGESTGIIVIGGVIGGGIILLVIFFVVTGKRRW